MWSLACDDGEWYSHHDWWMEIWKIHHTTIIWQTHITRIWNSNNECLSFQSNFTNKHTPKTSISSFGLWLSSNQVSVDVVFPKGSNSVHVWGLKPYLSNSNQSVPLYHFNSHQSILIYHFHDNITMSNIKWCMTLHTNFLRPFYLSWN